MRNTEITLQIDRLTPEQALAVYDFCTQMADSLWARHSDVLLEQLLQRPDRSGFTRTSMTTEQNHELPFEDDIPF